MSKAPAVAGALLIPLLLQNDKNSLSFRSAAWRNVSKAGSEESYYYSQKDLFVIRQADSLH